MTHQHQRDHRQTHKTCSTAAVLAALSSIAATAGAVGYAAISNYYGFDGRVWYVGGNVSEPEKNPAGAGYVSEPLQHDPVSGGRALKVFAEEDGLHNGAPHLNMVFNFEDPLVWYDVSEVFGSPFEGHQLKIEALDEGCEQR